MLEAGRAAGLGLRPHRSQLSPGEEVRLAVELDAASPTDFVYRPGVPLVRETFVAGRTVWSDLDEAR